ncbi:MAG: hypothetical protein DRO99_01900 [Candidatus Aenigmatarchaeota archaeon]|nr:MAG: hypothetical protein DRO99_01900 [Candidatus Aenigmarchaeota archaeon]
MRGESMPDEPDAGYRSQRIQILLTPENTDNFGLGDDPEKIYLDTMGEDDGYNGPGHEEEG